MRARRVLVLAVLALCTALGATGVAAQDATPQAAPASPQAVPMTGAPTTLTLVEHALHITNIDLGASGPSVGDMIVWGPDPLYDAANSTDTGATTQGTCVVFDATTADCLANEVIVFADGSTLQIQGIQAGSTVTSTRVIIGGSGKYRGASGTVTVSPTSDRTVWTKTFALWLPS
jgi:hypothetical protein